MERLDAAWRGLCEPATVEDWCVRLRGLLADFFDPADASGAYTLQRLEAALQERQSIADNVRQQLIAIQANGDLPQASTK